MLEENEKSLRSKNAKLKKFEEMSLFITVCEELLNWAPLLYHGFVINLDLK